MKTGIILYGLFVTMTCNQIKETIYNMYNLETSVNMFYSIKIEDTSPITCGQLCLSTEGCTMFYWNNSSSYILNTDDSPGIQSVKIASFYVKDDSKDQCNLDGYMNILGVLCVKVYTTPSDWFTANKTCNQDGGQLLVMRTNVYHLKLEALKTIPLSGYKYHIGGNDLTTEGDWSWIDDSPVITGQWRPNKPDDQGGNEDCLQLSFLRFNDVPCDLYTSHFLCEKPLI